MIGRLAANMTAGISLLIPWFFLQAVLLSSEKPRTVCEVLQDLDRYRGHIIEVLGEFTGGELRGECPPLKTGTNTWLNSIGLDFPKNPDVEREGQTQWIFDLSVYEQIGAKVAALQKAAPTKRIIAIVTGRLDAHDQLQVLTEGVPQPVFLGYGHLGVYPARLVLVNIRDVGYEDSSPSR